MAMTAAFAAVYVADAIILASMAQHVDLPDDFRKPDTAAVVEEPTPTAPKEAPAAESVSIRFSEPMQSAGLVRHKVTKTEKFLVSESWCPNCPAAKKKFLADGGSPDNILTIEQARKRGQKVSYVPFEFTIETTSEQIQPPSYRKEKTLNRNEADDWNVEGDWTPTREQVLNHLRTHENHAGKHWQKWHLETWPIEQLYALHNDDHNGVVPTFDGEPVAEATISGQPNSQALSEALAIHLTGQQSTQAEPLVAQGLFDITVDTPDSARVWIAGLLSKKKLEVGAVSVEWAGDRVLSIGESRIGITPGAKVTARKFGVSVSASLTGISYENDLSSVTLELDGAPDLTVRFE